MIATTLSAPYSIADCNYRLGAVIDPRMKTASADTTLNKVQELDATGALDGGKVLPGFKVNFCDQFAAAKRRLTKNH